MKHIISTELAPQAIGPYSQGVRVGDMVYLSGQIPLDPVTMELVNGNIAEQAERVFLNMGEVCRAAQAGLDDIVKLTIFLTDLADFAEVNEVMKRFIKEPFPARSTVQVVALPKGARIEVEAVVTVMPA